MTNDLISLHLFFGVVGFFSFVFNVFVIKKEIKWMWFFASLSSYVLFLCWCDLLMWPLTISLGSFCAHEFIPGQRQLTDFLVQTWVFITNSHQHILVSALLISYVSLDEKEITKPTQTIGEFSINTVGAEGGSCPSQEPSDGSLALSETSGGRWKGKGGGEPHERWHSSSERVSQLGGSHKGRLDRMERLDLSLHFSNNNSIKHCFSFLVSPVTYNSFSQ